VNEYRSTINLPECPRFQTAMFPDTPRTAVLVADGVLVPVVRAIMEPVDVPGFVEPFSPPELSEIQAQAAAQVVVVEIPEDALDEAPAPKPKLASKKRAPKAEG